MSFIISNFLWLLPLISAPIIIHLLKRQSYIKVNFSTLKFFKAIQSDSIRKNNITNILLLIIRTLILLIIILILSRPVYKGASNNPAHDTYLTIIADNTISNYYNLSNNFNSFIKSLDKTYDPNTKVDIYYLGDEKPLFNGPLSQYTNIKFKTNYYTPEITKNKLNFLENNKQDKHNLDLIYFSDFSDSTLNIEILEAVNVLSKYSIFLYNPDYNNNNMNISDFTIDKNIIIPNEIVSIRSKINNFSDKKLFNKSISLFTNDIKVGSINLDIESKQSTNIEFKTSYSDYGYNESYISIDDDDFQLDNNFYFNVHLPERYNITVIHDSSEDIYFISNFINAFNEKYKNITSRFINYEDYIKYDNVNDDVLFIMGYSKLTNEIIKKLNNTNTRVIVTPGINDFQNTHLHKIFNDDSLKDAKLNTLKGNSFLTINQKYINEKFISEYFEGDNSHRNIKVYKHINFSNSDNSVVKLNNNSSLINKYKINNNTFYLFTVGYNLKDSNLPIKGLFIPLLYNLMNHNLNTYYTFDDITDLNYADFFKKRIDIKFRDKKFSTTIPITNFNKFFNQTGFYKLKELKKIISFPININSSENYNIKKENYAKTAFKEYNYFTNKKDFISALQNKQDGIEIRIYLIYLLTIMIIIEMFLSNIYLNDRKK